MAKAYWIACYRSISNPDALEQLGAREFPVAVVGVGGRGTQNMKELLKLPDVQVIAVADPAESFGLEDFYYKGLGGRLPAIAAVERHYAEKTPTARCTGYEDFRVMLGGVLVLFGWGGRRSPAGRGWRRREPR